VAEDIGARIGDGRKPFTTQGEWWIPESDIKVGGTLSYADGRIRLSLVGLLEETPDPFSDEPIPVVFGMTSDGIEVTLCDCRYLDWQSAETHGSLTSWLERSSSALIFRRESIPSLNRSAIPSAASLHGRRLALLPITRSRTAGWS